VEEQSKPPAPLSVQLLPEIGDEAMQREAGAWFENNEPIG
jgi:hypothetical protein